MNANPRLFSFVGGRAGPWKTTEPRAIKGEALPAIERLNVVAGRCRALARWSALAAAGRNQQRALRHAAREGATRGQVPALSRLEADCAVLIPVKKNAQWWALTQDERRANFEAQSHHTQIGLEYLPAIARRLHHCRDLSEVEPFDFLTWFEFAKADTGKFDTLLSRLRTSAKWQYVEREVEIRLVRDNSAAAS